ncbi:MAG TPA: VIT1/CCC1 transporter family protein [Actinomycetota bacterium]
MESNIADQADAKTIAAWKHHWRDESDAAFLYGVLADVETDGLRRDFFRRFVELETRHVEAWADLLRRNGVEVGRIGKPTMRTRLTAWLARRFGPAFLLSMLHRQEGQEVRNYLQLHETSPAGRGKDTALTLAQESAGHAEDLRKMSAGIGESWHRTGAGGMLRNVVYGFNDGLTANFGLVAGVVGAAASTADHHDVLVAGVAGVVAGAMSMASSGYLAAKSEAEVHAHEIALERQEIEMMPEAEEEELALIYETRGIEPERARALAADVMKDPVRALEEKVREELGIGEPHTTPIKEGGLTGGATAVGSLLPVLPFMLLDGTSAIWTSFGVAMASHFAVGGARSVFTGRGLIRSGIDMFVVGLGVAVAGYFVGVWITELL